MTDSNTIEILRRARERLSSPERWCKGRSARTACGDPALVDGPDAVSWCVEGAVHVEAQLMFGSSRAYLDGSEAKMVLRDATREIAGSRPRDFNDMRSTTHADVLALLDEAIDSLSSARRSRSPRPRARTRR